MQISSYNPSTSRAADSIAQRVAQKARKKEPFYNYDTYRLYLSQLDRTSAKKIRRKAGKLMQKRIEKDVFEDNPRGKRKAADSSRGARAAKRTKAEATESPSLSLPSPKNGHSKDDGHVLGAPSTPSPNSSHQSRKRNAASRTTEHERELPIKKEGTPTKPIRRLFTSPSTSSTHTTRTKNEETSPLTSFTGSPNTDLRRQSRRRPRVNQEKIDVESTNLAKELYPANFEPGSSNVVISPTQKSTKNSFVADKENQYRLHPQSHLLQTRKKKHRKGSV
ncbi:unnamed protein product [Phytomonas sp. Hart1]|nr:unnamed protein product [Phytomonas sp. Hart1]|eukprot:CCW70608.1 unnamed protein product [Phytomonas sp. isolate Hart1]